MWYTIWCSSLQPQVHSLAFLLQLLKGPINCFVPVECGIIVYQIGIMVFLAHSCILFWYFSHLRSLPFHIGSTETAALFAWAVVCLLSLKTFPLDQCIESQIAVAWCATRVAISLLVSLNLQACMLMMLCLLYHLAPYKSNFLLDSFILDVSFDLIVLSHMII